jgi:two-component system sensor histidine kinase SenX3
MINHEYRTPLAIIQANLSLLEIKTASTDLNIVPVYNKIKRAMERLVEVLETSISLEHQSGPCRWRHQQTIYLGSFLRGVLQEVKNLWPDRCLQACIPDVRGISLTGDSILIKTALLNLLDNAFKYSAHDQEVSLGVQIQEGKITITVTDNGCGIPEDQLELVFEKDFRADNAMANSGKGFGLYLAKSIVEQYGGSISLASNLSAGSIVTVQLPHSVQAG